MEYHSDSTTITSLNKVTSNIGKHDFNVVCFSKNSNNKCRLKLEKHKKSKRYKMDKSKNKYAGPSESNNSRRQSANENDEKFQHESNQTDDENSNKSLSHSNQNHKSDQFVYLSDCNDNNEQSQPSSEKNKEKQNKSDDIDNKYDSLNDKDDLNSFQKVKHKKSKHYELRSSYSGEKDKSNKYADLSESDDVNEHRKSSNKSDEEYHLTSGDTSEFFSGKYVKNLAKREKHKKSKRYELRASHSDKKDKSNKYTVTSDSDDHSLLSNEGDEKYRHISEDDGDDKNDSSNSRDNDNSTTRENHKKSKRYKHSNKTDKSNKDADRTKSGNEHNHKHESESEYDSFNIRDNKNKNTNKKPKKSKRFELQKLHLQNKYESINYTDTSDNDDDDYTWSQSSNLSDNSDDIDDKIESSNNRDNENSNFEIVTPYTKFFKRRTHHIGLDERINMLKAYYHFNFSYHKLSSMFNCTRQQIGETLANRKDIIKEYKKQHRDFDEKELKTPKSRVCNTLNLNERIDVLRAYNRHHYEHRKLASMFNCSKRQIEYTLANRMALIKEYKKQHPDFDDIEFITPKNRGCNNKLSWDKRIDIIKAYHHQGYTPYKLACMFNCSPGQIHNILINRKDIIKEYKKQHPDFVEAKLKAPNDEHINNNLSLHERIDILRCHDSYDYHYCKLASLFSCSMGQIENTLVNRKTHIEEYKKQHPDFNENELKTPKNRVPNILSLDKCIDVIKAYEGEHNTPYKLACLFKCSMKEIKSILKNHMDIIKEYKKQHPDFDENVLKIKKKRVCNTFELKATNERICNNLSLDERIGILRAHDSNHYPYYKLASMFNCSMGEIENTLINRKTLIEKYKIQYPDFDEKELKTQKNPLCNSLSLDERIGVIKAYHRNHLSHYKLACVFNCSMEQIENILANRKALIEDYKTEHPDYDENDLQVSHYADNKIMKSKNVNKLTLEKCKEVIEAYDADGDYVKLSRLFNFSIAQMKSIIQNRDGIIKKYETSIYNISNNDYQDDIQIESTCLNSVNKLSLNDETTVQNVSQTQHTGNSNTNNGDEDNYKNLNDLTAEDTGVNIGIEDKEFPTHHEDIYDVSDQVNDSYKLYDINREPTNCINNSSATISNEMGQICFLKSNMNSKQSNSNQNDDDDDNDDYDSIELTNDRTLRWNKLYLRKYVQVIKAYDEKNSYSALASRFNCSWILIYNIIENRHIVLKALGSRIQIKLTLVERLDVIRDYMCNNYSYRQLSQIYHCSLEEIEKCIRDRSSYNKIVNRLYPVDIKPKHKSKSKGDISKINIPSLIIRAFDQYPNEMLLSRLYSYSLPKIFKIIENRDEILKEYQNSNSQTNIFENLTISRHRDILLALKPLAAYAKLINNSAAINIISELEEHLNCFNKNIPESNYSLQKNVEICSYNDALNALRPIGDFTQLTNNNNAKNIISQLAMHLIKNIKTKS